MTDVNDPPPRRNVSKSFRALILGFLVVVLASTGTDILLQSAGIFPASDQRMSDPLFLLALGYRVVFAIAGCWVAARLAPDRPMRHALALGSVGLALSVVGAATMWGAAPPWYHLGLIVTALPSAWLGGRLLEGRSIARTA